MKKPLTYTTKLRLFRHLLLASLAMPVSGFAAEPGGEFTLDFRHAPASWQTAICLPDDWQKTLVGKDGALLYDYPGKQAGFGTRIQFEAGSPATWVSQSFVSPRVPIVRTVHRSGDLEILQEAFALAPPMKPAGKPVGLSIERLGQNTGESSWAWPPPGSDPAFKDVAIGWKEPIQFHFKAARNRTYTVVFGLCEGYHQKPGERVLKLETEGGTARTVDIIAEQGRNVPDVYSLVARDADGDGWVDVKVSATKESPDQNTILNTLWVFDRATVPSRDQLISGMAADALAHINCAQEQASDRVPRHDLLLVRIRNTGPSNQSVGLSLRVERDSSFPVQRREDGLRLGASSAVEVSEPIEKVDHSGSTDVLRFKTRIVPAGKGRSFCLAVSHGNLDAGPPLDLSRALQYRSAAERYWQTLPLPYGRLQVPDAGVQALLDSSVRNIYQAREIKKGLPAFQVGPTCYRGLWVVDGSFLLEAVTYLGRIDEARKGIEYLMTFQRPDGGFMLMDGHWKETGIALWAISRHARLSGDKAWLRSVWPQVQRGFEFIRKMRQMPAADAPNAQLIPDGFSDGGLADKVPEYTNIYWTMAGLSAAIAAGQWLGEDTADWQHEYGDFRTSFRRAAQRDLRKDAAGNAYLPIRMQKGEGIPPQKAQWAFLHALFPGKVFEPDDLLVRGNMAMLKAVECEGLVRDTGWLKEGLWTYFGSFYGHAWLWLGDGDKAARTLYAFGNHASPLLAWREEQMPTGEGGQVVGDMPHNWASAEFIRLVRHSLMLERGDELHLFEGLPGSWIKPGATLQAKDIATEFGPVSLELKVDRDGTGATLKLTPPRRTAPGRIVLHAKLWSAKDTDLELPAASSSKTRIPLR